ncbi:cytochrome b/b6 domain-containing protein [Acidisoma sp. C75]
MSFLSPQQILSRARLSRQAVYQAGSHDTRRSHLTRVLHLAILISVVNQLLTSQFMGRPFPGVGPSTLFVVHEYIGIGSLGLVMIFWLWTLIRHGETKLGRLFPWFSPRAIAAVLRDAWGQLKSLMERDPLAESDGAFASAVHGLGLLVLTGLAVTGTAYFVTRGTITSFYMLELHAAMGNLMWAYLIGHAGIGALHHLLGHDILRPMFWIRRGITITTPRRRGERTAGAAHGQPGQAMAAQARCNQQRAAHQPRPRERTAPVLRQEGGF